MAFTYNAAELSEPLNQLRFLVQDTVDAGHFFEDEEITYTLSQKDNIHRAAAVLCRAMAAKLVRTPSQKDTTITFDSEARIRELRLLADNYDKEADRAEKALEQDAGGSIGGTISLTANGGCGNESAFTRDLHFSR